MLDELTASSCSPPAHAGREPDPALKLLREFVADLPARSRALVLAVHEGRLADGVQIAYSLRRIAFVLGDGELAAVASGIEYRILIGATQASLMERKFNELDRLVARIQARFQNVAPSGLDRSRTC